MARGVVLAVLVRKHAEIRGYLSDNLPGCGRFISTLRCEIYVVSNGNSDICGHPRPMMEGECSL